MLKHIYSIKNIIKFSLLYFGRQMEMARMLYVFYNEDKKKKKCNK